MTPRVMGERSDKERDRGTGLLAEYASSGEEDEEEDTRREAAGTRARSGGATDAAASLVAQPGASEKQEAGGGERGTRGRGDAHARAHGGAHGLSHAHGVLTEASSRAHHSADVGGGQRSGRGGKAGREAASSRRGRERGKRLRSREPWPFKEEAEEAWSAKAGGLKGSWRRVAGGAVLTTSQGHRVWRRDGVKAVHDEERPLKGRSKARCGEEKEESSEPAAEQANRGGKGGTIAGGVGSSTASKVGKKGGSGVAKEAALMANGGHEGARAASSGGTVGESSGRRGGERAHPAAELEAGGLRDVKPLEDWSLAEAQEMGLDGDWWERKEEARRGFRREAPSREARATRKEEQKEAASKPAAEQAVGGVGGGADIGVVDGAATSARPPSGRGKAFASSQIDPEMRFDEWQGMPPDFDWRSLLVQQGDAEYNVGTLLRQEAVVAERDTVFADELRKLLAVRGEEPIMRTSYRLPQLLEVLAEDSGERRSAFLWMTMSRGVALIPPGTKVKRSHMDNYRSAEVDNRDMAESELRGFIKKGYVGDWARLAKEVNSSDPEPWIILPIGVVVRFGKPRVYFDPGVSVAGREHSVNELIVIDGKCCLTSIKHAMASMSEYSWFWRADLKSAFLQLSLSARSRKFCGLRWRFKGTTKAKDLGFRRLGFGFSLGPWVQACLSVAICRRVSRKCIALGLTTSAPLRFDTPATMRYPAPSPDAPLTAIEPGTFGKRRHKLTAVHQFLDDYGGFANSELAGSFSFVQFLLACQLMGVIVCAEAGKTDPPTREACVYLGFEILCRLCIVRLPAEKIARFNLKLADIAGPEATLRTMRSVVGVLVHGAAVLPCARGAYQNCLELLRTVPHDARPSHVLTLTQGVWEDAIYYKELMRVLNGMEVVQGVRRFQMKWHIWTDASLIAFGGWCGLGLKFSGRWPSTWDKRIGQFSHLHNIFICELEAWALLFAIRKWVGYAAGGRLVIHCDNLPVVFMIRHHRARSKRCIPIIAEIEALCVLFNVEIDTAIMHCRTYDNKGADLLSRQWDSDFVQEELDEFEVWLARKAAVDFPVLPAWGDYERPEVLPFVRARRASMDAWGAELSAGDIEMYEALLPFYISAGKHKAMSPEGAGATVPGAASSAGVAWWGEKAVTAIPRVVGAGEGNKGVQEEVA